MFRVYTSKHNDLLSIWIEEKTGRLFVWYNPQYGWTRYEDLTNFATALEPKS